MARCCPGPDRKLPSGVPSTVSVNGTRAPVTLARDFRVGGTELGASVATLVPRRLLFDQTYDSDRQYDGFMGEDYLRRFQRCRGLWPVGPLLEHGPRQEAEPEAGLAAGGLDQGCRCPACRTTLSSRAKLTVNRFRMLVDTGSPFAVMDRGMLRGCQGLGVQDIPMRGGVIGSQAASRWAS